MSPFEYRSGLSQVTIVIVSIIRFTLRVSGLCQSCRQRRCTQENGRKYTVSLWIQGSNSQEEVRTGDCAFPYNGPWCNDVFLSLPFSTLIKAFLVGYIYTDAMLCQLCTLMISVVMLLPWHWQSSLTICCYVAWSQHVAVLTKITALLSHTSEAHCLISNT